MTRDEKRTAMLEFLDLSPPILNNQNDLSEALFTMDELGIWPDSVDSVSREQCIFCWTLVSRLLSDKLPEELKM